MYNEYTKTKNAKCMLEIILNGTELQTHYEKKNKN